MWNFISRGVLAVAIVVLPARAALAFQEPAEGLSGVARQVEAGDRAFAERDYSSAVEAYSGVSPLDLPPESVNRLAVSQFMTGRPRDAERMLRFAIGRSPDLPTLRNNLGAIHYAEGDYGDAKDRILDALERFPDNGHFQWNLRLARYAEEHRRESESRQQATTPREWVESVVGDAIRIRSLMPEEVASTVAELERRGDAFLARKMFDGAASEYQRLVRMEEENFAVVHKLGLAHHHLGELDEAEDLYRDALDINPYYIPSLNNLGSLEHMRGRPDRALEYFARVLEIRPDWPMALKNVGLLLFTVERYEEGLGYFLRALALDPELLESRDQSGLPIIAQSTPANTGMFSYYMARVSATAGNADLTMSYLYRAVEEGVTDPALIRDPAFALLASDERYIALLESLNGA